MAKIVLEKLCNTRDLGGTTAALGKKIKPCRLIRSGALYNASENDIELLKKEYNLKTVVDFRTPTECTRKPAPEIEGVQYIWIPVLDEETLGITRDDETGKSKSVIEMICEPGFDPISYMSSAYIAMMTNGFSLTKYKIFIDVLLNNSDGAILWHCSAGKDRAGLASAFALMTLGVKREDIIADYLFTNECVTGDIQKAVCENNITDDHIKECIKTVFGVDRPYIESVFSCIDEKFGGTDKFLKDVFGIGEKEKEILYNKYLED